MKRYGSLLLLITITFMMLASNVLPSSAAPDMIATATKTPTKKPVKTPKGPAINTIMQQVRYYVQGAPNDGNKTQCKTSKSPMVLSGLNDVKQLESLELTSCAWNLDQDVTATIQKSDGTTLTETLPIYKYSPLGILILSYTPTAFDPIGKYKISFSNGKQALDVEFNVNPITEPGTVIIHEAHEVQVYNFHPYEAIRVFQYDLSISTLEDIWAELFEWNLKAWRDLRVRSDGKLRFPIDDTRAYYVVIGEETGEYNTDRGAQRMGSIVNTSSPVVNLISSCPGTLASRVGVGLPARVTTRTHIRQEPAISAGLITVLPKETLFLILGDSECNDGYRWWYGVTNNGVEGWIAESQRRVYLLEPVP